MGKFVDNLDMKATESDVESPPSVLGTQPHHHMHENEPNPASAGRPLTEYY